MKYIIGMDVGTSSLKAVLYDEQFNAVKDCSIAYEMSQPKNGWAEQNPEDWCRASDEALQTLSTYATESGGEIASIGLTGQMHSMVLLDEENRVLRPAILWCDQRTAEECRFIEDTLGRDRLIEVTANPALTGFTLSKLLWVKRHEPEIYAKCRHLLLAKDFIRFYLTGEYATDVSDASGMQLLDVPARCWSDEVIRAFDIDERILPSVHESVDVTGYVTATAAARTGLAAGIPVVAGAGDNAAAAVGCGVIEEGKAFTTIGTSGVVFAHSDQVKIDPAGRVHSFCAAVPGTWHVMGVTLAAGLSVNWFVETLYKHKENPYAYVENDLQASPIGSDRLLYLPYLMGERTPHLDPQARGAFIGLSAKHENKDMLRAVIEGVTFSLRDCYEIITKEMEIPLSEMMLTGGGTRNDTWNQIIADNYGCEVIKTSDAAGTTLGAALLASVGAGLHPDLPTAWHGVTVAEASYGPHKENKETYDRIYTLYGNSYRALQPIYAALADEEA